MEQENNAPNELSTSSFRDASQSPSDTCQFSTEESTPQCDSDCKSYEPGVSSTLKKHFQHPIEYHKKQGIHCTVYIINWIAHNC